MFAPFASSRAPRGLAVAALVLAVALLAGGCTLPGRGRLAPAPKDLPASMHWVPSDAPAFLVVDTDTSSKSWQRLRGGGAAFVRKDLAASFLSSTGDGGPRLIGRATRQLNTFRELDPQRWVGPAAGAVLLSTDLASDDAVYGYADVRDRRALETALRSENWKRDGDTRGFARWTGHGLVAAVSAKTVLFAGSSKALDTILSRAAQGRVSDDLDLRKDAVESLRNAPVGVVFREDALANQLRRIVRDDPAKLELTRWLDDSSLIASVLDGWVGVNGHEVANNGLQLTGRLHWVPESLRVRRPGTVSRSSLDRQSPAVDGAVVFDDLGLVAEDLVGAATANGSEFATEEDVPDAADRVELFPTLDELDGDSVATIVNGGVALAARTDDPKGAARDVRAAVAHLGLDDAVVSSNARGVAIYPHGQRLVLAPASADRGTDGGTGGGTPPSSLAERDDYVDARQGLATAPRRTLAWFTFLRQPFARVHGTTCVGWLGEAGHDRLALSVSVTPPATAGDLAGGCTAPLAGLL